MDEIEREIHAALAALAVPSESFNRVEAGRASAIVREAKARFVAGDPRVWWLSLTVPHATYSYPDGTGPQHLTDHLRPNESRGFFIPEIDADALPVYDVDLRYVAPVLGECRYFEYYLVGDDLTWIAIENDHNQLLFARLPADAAAIAGAVPAP